MVREISPNFLCVGIRGLSSDSFLQGRPYGGCSILYCKSLSLCVTPLHSCSNHFCSLKICDSSGVSYLLICVYMPSDCGTASYSDYLNTLCELEGFIFFPIVVMLTWLLVTSMLILTMVVILLHYFLTL